MGPDRGWGGHPGKEVGPGRKMGPENSHSPVYPILDWRASIGHPKSELLELRDNLQEIG